MSIENLKTFGEWPRHRQCLSVYCAGGAIVARPLRFTSVINADLADVTDPFAEADEDTGETKQSQNYIHIRIQRVF